MAQRSFTIDCWTIDLELWQIDGWLAKKILDRAAASNMAQVCFGFFLLGKVYSFLQVPEETWTKGALTLGWHLCRYLHK